MWKILRSNKCTAPKLVCFPQAVVLDLRFAKQWSTLRPKAETFSYSNIKSIKCSLTVSYLSEFKCLMPHIIVNYHDLDSFWMNHLMHTKTQIKIIFSTTKPMLITMSKISKMSSRNFRNGVGNLGCHTLQSQHHLPVSDSLELFEQF